MKSRNHPKIKQSSATVTIIRNGEARKEARFDWSVCLHVESLPRYSEQNPFQNYYKAISTRNVVAPLMTFCVDLVSVLTKKIIRLNKFSISN